MSDTISRARMFMMQAHQGQTRKDGNTPYARHPDSVHVRLARAGVTDETVLVAALLHDALEDTEATEEDILAKFGPAALGLVLELTREKPKDTRRAYADSFRTKSREACILKLADRLDNLQDWAGMDPGYRSAYALEGLRILTACAENERAMPSHLSAPFRRLCEDLFEECHRHIKWCSG